jgi:hypothetical protein
VAAICNRMDVADSVVQRAVSEMVSGVELLELQNDDLRELGILKMGPRKKLLGRIQKLKERGAAALDDSVSEHRVRPRRPRRRLRGRQFEQCRGRRQSPPSSRSRTTSSRFRRTSRSRVVLLQLSHAFGCRVKVKLEDSRRRSDRDHLGPGARRRARRRGLCAPPVLQGPQVDRSFRHLIRTLARSPAPAKKSATCRARAQRRQAVPTCRRIRRPLRHVRRAARRRTS